MSIVAIPSPVLAQHTAILGKTGSGKSTIARLCVEQVVDEGERVCILDPIKSDWWGLISSADGRKPGLPFQILGGPRQHVPLHANAGKAIADVVATGALPLSILDMADFAPGGQMKFFADFAPQLLKRMRGVLYLVMEEAHLFAPKERAGFGAENMSIHWAKTIASAGRSKGIRLLVLTQRTQALHNALLGSCDSLIALRMTAPADQEPVIKWLRANVRDKAVRDQVEGSLPSIKTGDGWLCSGEARIFELLHFPRPRTYDNTKTPESSDGEHQVKTATVDADKLRAIIGEAVKEAEANDPAALKSRIVELERQLKAGGATRKELDETRRNAFEQGLRAATAPIVGKLAGILKAGDDFMGRLREIAESIDKQSAAPAQVTIHAPAQLSPATRKALEQTARHAVAEVKRVQAVAAGRPHGGELASPSEHRISRPQQVILNRLAALEGRGIYPTSRETLAAFCAVSPSSSGYEKNLGTLKTAGLVEYPLQGHVAFTEEGRACAVSNDDGRPLHEFWLQILNEPKAKIIRALLERQPLTREELAAASDQSDTSSGFEKNLGTLRTLGAIDYPQKGSVALTRHVVPE